MLSCVWGDIMKKIDVNELVLKQGFKVFIQISSQKDDNLIGYVWVGNTDVNANKRIVIDQDKLNEAGLEKEYYYRYYIALALSYYQLSGNAESFYQELRTNVHDIEVENLASEMLMPSKGFQKYSKKYKKDIIRLMDRFEVPSTVVEERLSKQKKNKVKVLKR
jgi:hypothetical protein